jgi:hypothetical protein
LKTTVQYSWNLGVQRQISSSLFASATYIGTHLIHTWTNIDPNPAIFIPGNCAAGQFGLSILGPCSTPGNINFRRTLYLASPTTARNLGTITMMDDGGTQGYNGMLLNMTWRQGRTINVAGNYTWSHCIGLPITTLSNSGAAYPHEPWQNAGTQNRRLDMGDCATTTTASQDRRHVANATLVLNTTRASSGWAGRFASGWTFSTILRAQSGSPLTAITGSDVAINGIAAATGANPVPQRPNQVLADTTSPTRGQACTPAPCVSYLNASAFVNPVPGTYGNLGVSTLRGPGFWGWDQTISRQFQITEGQRIEIRAEAFNVTNSVHLGNPNTSMQGGQFGTIRTANDPRIMQWALKYIF